MDIKSEPVTIDEKVTDIEVILSSGIVRQYTLREADTTVEGELAVILSFAEPPEVITIFKAHAAILGVRARIIRRPVPKPTEAIKTPAQA